MVVNDAIVNPSCDDAIVLMLVIEHERGVSNLSDSDGRDQKKLKGRPVRTQVKCTEDVATG
jgi:hypothetical protein